ncbi:MAG: dTMP kinase [Nitrospirota bacterium]
MRKESRALFIVFEGIDQAGKQTQVERLSSALSHKGCRVKTISFPDYDTPIGREIKRFLEGKKELPIQLRYLLYTANRWERDGDIRKWLSEGYIVISDRYSASNLVYGIVQGLDVDWMLTVEKGLIQPDLTILIDISERTSLQRKQSNRDIYEGKIEFLKSVRNAYLELAMKDNWKIINGEQSVDEISKEIRKIIDLLLA